MGVLDIEYNSGNGALEELLLSVDRPGDFCAHGKLFAPMPRLEVEGVGLLSFPVPDMQVRALIAAAERAPYCSMSCCHAIGPATTSICPPRSESSGRTPRNASLPISRPHTSPGIPARCSLCEALAARTEELRAFCDDPDARVARFPLRKELRAHLEMIIRTRRLDIDTVTERKGRPHTLVCTKNRASHRRRLAEYAEDVSHMESLVRSAPGGAQAARCASELARLREAVAAGKPAGRGEA